MQSLFTAAFMRWAGTNLVGADDRQRAAYRDHLDSVALPALTAAAGSISCHRLEKMVQSPRRSFGPDFLTVWELDGRPGAAAPEVLVPANAAWRDAFEPMWSMTWRKIADTGAAQDMPDRVRLLALSPPADASDNEIAEWNRFYTEVHIGEAMQRRGWTRATRWKLDHADLHPAPACPQYFVLYEAKGFRDASDAEVASWGPWSEGPPIWKRHVGAWTLDYRVVKPEN
jgi:hypothetical protein